MKLKIYNQFNELKLTVSPSDNSTRQRGVMADHVLGLSFVSFDFVRLEVNDWVEFEGLRYWLVEEYVPKQTSTVEWEYDVKFYGPENLLSQALMLKTVDGENDPVFSLTAPAHEQVALVVENINRQMGTTDWKVGEVIDTENLVVDYEGTYCNEALNKIADAAETEWWIDGMTVNLGRCEYGESVPLGYANGAESIDIASANGVKFFTRLFPIGSSRNIDREHYGAARLQLPGGAKYVEQDTHLGIVEHYEREAFSGIYPRRVGKVGSVRSENATGEDGDPFTIYYFKDEELSFDPNTYEIGGLVKQVTFQSGELNGREFEVNFDSKSREFEIITQWPYEDETQLPGGLLVPKPGDEYILWNLRMPDEYYTLAEQEFAEAVEAYMLKHRKDRRVYKITTDYVDIGARGLRFDIGQRIRLESTRYFPESGYRDSRIVRFTQNLNIPTQYDLEISDVLSTGTLSRIEDNIEEVRNYTRIATSNLPDVVRSWENTPPSDFNLFSAKRSCKEFLSKRQGGTVEGQVRFMQRITLDKGFRTHDFASGPTGFGGQIDEQGVSELESLVLRRSLTVPELNYNRVEISVGDDWSAPGGGIIKEIDTSQQLVTLKLEDGERGAVAVGDICMGIFHSTTLSDNAAEDADDSRGNRTFAGFATAYFRITEVLGDHNEQFKYELRPVSTSYPAQITPMISMKFVAYGSFTDASRRTSRYSTRTYQRYLRGVSDWEFTAENIAAQFGDLSNLSVFGLAMSGYSAYLDNIYMQGLLRSLDGTFIIDTKTRSLLMASGETGVGLAFNPEQGLKIGAVYDPETGKFQKEYDIEQIAKTANDTKEELDNLQYSADNIVNGSHADWVAARTDAYGYESGNNLGIDYTLIRGNLITYRVELKGESAQASELGFEIKITYSDGTTQWLTRYTTPYIPDRGTFEKTYTFSSQVQDKEIASAVLYPVFKSSSGGEVSGKLYIRHEFVGVGNKLPAMWSPSIADQKKYTDDKVDNIQIGGVNLMRNTQHPDPTDTAIWNNNNGLPSIWGEVGEFTAYKIQQNWGRLWQTIPGGYKAGQQYTFSCMVKRDATQETAVTKAAIYILSGMYIIRASIGGRVIASNTSSAEIQIPLSPDIFEKLEVTFVADQDIADGLGMRIEFFAVPYIDNTPCGVVYGYKLETGNKATAWSEAAEDVKAGIDAAVDGIHIGGVNILNDSESITFDSQGGVWGKWNSVNTETFEGYKCAVVRNPKLRVTNGAFLRLEKVENARIAEGSSYMASAYVWTNEPVGIRIGLENSEGFVFIIDSTMTGKWIRLSSYQKAVKDNPAFVLYANPTTSTTVVAFRMAQLEGGNKATAWSPSVADQEKYTDEKVENIQFSAVNLINNTESRIATASTTDNYGRIEFRISEEVQSGDQFAISIGEITNLVGDAELYAITLYNTTYDRQLSPTLRLTADNRAGVLTVYEGYSKQPALLFVFAGNSGSTAGNSVRYDKIMFVRGNKPSLSWSPSVADQQAEIDAARKAADDAAAGVDSLKNFTDKAFADGIIDRAEAASIEKYINSVSETKNAVAASYTVVYENSLLGGTAKSNLHAAKSAFDTAVASLLASISTASADGVATAEEKAGVDAKYAIFNEAYSTYTVRIEEAEKYIQIAINTKAQGAYQIAEELQGKISNINRILEDHQSQIDGQIVSWTGTEVPTLRNYPASQWTTPEEVARHENDLYDREISADNGQKVYESYKFRNIDGTYQWVRIADSDSAAVRIIAEDALGIASCKSANFYGSTVPVPPYHIDDVWYKSIPGKQELQGVYICNTDREKGDTALLSDWGLVDDSAARLRQMSSDSVISKEEKASLRNTLVQREKEMAAYRKDATTYGVSISALNTAYQSLVNFLTGTVAVNNNTDTELTSEQRASYNGYFAAYDAEVSRFMNLVADAVAQQKVNDIQLGTNILNGSHADWVAAFAGGSGYATGDSVLYLDHTLIRGKQITYRVELKGEGAQAPNLGFEIKVHFTDGTDQWLARYSAGDIPERGTFEKAYTFSSQVQDKEIEYARLYPVFRSLSGGEASGKLYIRHEFVGVGNKLPSTWSPSVADQETKIPDVEYIKKLFPASMDVDGAAIAQTLAVKNDAGSQVLGFINGSSNFSDPTHGICMMAMGMSSITGWKTAKTRLYGDGHFVSASAEITGKITAQTGVIGPFTITTSYLTGTEGSSSLRLSSNLIRFTDTYSSAYIGNNVFPASMGDTVRGPARFEVNRSVSSGSANVGVYVSSSGATDYDDMIDSGNHALYIPSGDICGLRFRVRRLSSSQTLSEMDTFILVTTSGTIDLTLPSSPQPGQLYFFKLIGSGKFNIKVGASGHYISNNRSDRITTWGFNSAPIIMLVWDRVNKIWHGGHLAAG